MKKILTFLKPYKWGVILVFILVAARAVLDLLLPMILGKLVNEGLGYGEFVKDPNVRKIYEYSAIMLSVTIVSIGVTITSGFMESRISSSFAMDLRKAVYKKIESFSMVEMNHFTTSSLITRSTNDIQMLQNYINSLMRMIILQPFLAIGAITFSVSQHGTLSMILIASIFALLIMLVSIFSVTLPRFQIMQKLVDRLNLVTRENLTGLRVVRAFNTQEFQANRIDEASKKSRDINVFVNRVAGLMWPIMSIIQGATSLAIVYLGSKYFIGLDGFDPGTMMALMQYAMRAVMSFMFLTMIFIMIPRATISARRIKEVLEMEIIIKDPENPIELPEKIKGEIKFKNVSFKYPGADEPVLTNISFTARSGETTALIGSTGSGKSTLINLVPRFYERSEGEITIDDIDIKDLKQEDLYKLIGYVPQKGILFSGTIEDNIMFGQDNYKDEDIEFAAEIAQAKNFVESFEDKYKTLIAQGGTNVSGGQRQRLSIARAIAKNPQIYIFDDSFSALDYKTDQNLRNALDKNIKATKLIVAQRINTIRYAEQIIVLDKGTIVGIGKHDELMKSCKVYQEIAYSQLSKEEL